MTDSYIGSMPRTVQNYSTSKQKFNNVLLSPANFAGLSSLRFPVRSVPPTVGYAAYGY